MNRFVPGIAILLCVSLLDARQEKLTCGTHALKPQEELELHRQSQRVALQRSRKLSVLRAAGEREVGGVSVRPDVGNLAILDDADGVVARRNPFNLNRTTIRFVPVGSTERYKFEREPDTYDATLAESGSLLSNLKDDDSQE